jgi:hypothetical protein
MSLNKAGSDELERYQRFPPFSIGLVAQSAEQPVVCGKAEGANPFGSAIHSMVTGSVFLVSSRCIQRRLTRNQKQKTRNIREPLLWPSEIRRSSSKRTDAGANPVSSSSFHLPGSVKVARRSVKPLELVQVQSRQPFIYTLLV